MLTKILFTIIVILIVAVVFRHKNMTNDAKKPRLKTPAPKKSEGVQPRTIIYTILGLLIAVSALIFLMHWQNEHQIINIQVTDASGNLTNYQAYRKSIEGKKFETLEGIQVTLGDSDRVEMRSTEE